jgi:hypothetical protein
VVLNEQIYNDKFDEVAALKGRKYGPTRRNNYISRAEKRRYGIMFCKHRDESNMPRSLNIMDKNHICKRNAANVLSGILYSLTYLWVCGMTVIWPCDTMTLLSMCVASVPFLRLAGSFASNLVIALMLQHDKRVIAFAFCLSFSCGLCSNITL